jgi:hypothetical protein
MENPDHEGEVTLTTDAGQGMQAHRECRKCGQQERPDDYSSRSMAQDYQGDLNDYDHCHLCEEEERTSPANPVDTHTLVADLVDLGYASQATTAAISFAQADAYGGKQRGQYKCGRALHGKRRGMQSRTYYFRP